VTKTTKSEAAYKKATVKGKNCGTCASMNADGTCDKVKGIVTRPYVCRLYTRAKK
jgi:hypothetical protein